MRAITNKRGQVIVELAFLLPLLLGFTFAIAEYGRAFYIRNALTQAARSGARLAIVTPNLQGEEGQLSGMSSKVASVVRKCLVGVEPEKVTYTLDVLDWPDSETETPTCVTNTAQVGNYVVVRLTYPYQMITPLPAIMTNLLGRSPARFTSKKAPSGTVTIAGTAYMRYE